MMRHRFYLLLVCLLLSSWQALAFGFYTISAAAGTGGEISPAAVKVVLEGKSQRYTIKPTNSAIYRISNVVVDGKSKGALSSYTFSNVKANHTIKAYFKKRLYTLKPVNLRPSAGSISYTRTALEYGEYFRIHATPLAGYKAVIAVDGKTVSTGTASTVLKYTLRVKKQHAIEVRFYKVSASTSSSTGSTSTTGSGSTSGSTTGGSNTGGSSTTGSGAAGGGSTSSTSYAIQLQWNKPESRSDGSPLLVDDIAGYEIYYTTASGSVSEKIIVQGGEMTSGVVTLNASGTYYFSIVTVDKYGEKSELTAPLTVVVP